MRARGLVAVVVLAAGVTLPALPSGAVINPGSVVSVSSDSAVLDTFQFVDNNAQATANKSGDNFFTFAEHRGPPKSHGVEGTASGFVSAAASIETPAQPGFPIGPINDIAMSGISTSAATAAGKGAAVPVADSDGSFQAEVDTTAPVPIFFSGAIHTTNTDAKHSCSSVTVDFAGPNFDRRFEAFTGSDCMKSGPHQKAWAESFTLPAAGEYGIDVEYSSAVDDNIDMGDARSTSASATASLNMAFFPPRAKFSQTISGSTASFDGAGSSAADTHHHLAKWEWTFGDGKTATTSKPTVTHTYPASPRKAPTYTVTLQVVEAGGALSPKVSHVIRGTAVSVKVKRGPALAFTATVAPNRRGRPVNVTLARKLHGKFHVVATLRGTLTSHSRFAAEFEGPPTGRCQLAVRYRGDRTHLASRGVKTFAC
jgi:PKD domain